MKLDRERLNSMSKQDEHTDYKDNWMEKAIYFAAEHMHANTSEKDIINLLKEEFKVPEDNLSLILVSAKMLYDDEINEFTGDE